MLTGWNACFWSSEPCLAIVGDFAAGTAGGGIDLAASCAPLLLPLLLLLLLVLLPLPHLNLFRVEASTASGFANLNDSLSSEGEPIMRAVARGERPAFAPPPPPAEPLVKLDNKLELLGE